MSGQSGDSGESSVILAKLWGWRFRRTPWHPYLPRRVDYHVRRYRGAVAGERAGARTRRCAG